MNSSVTQISARTRRLLGLGAIALLLVSLVIGPAWQAASAAPPPPATGVAAPLVQQFEDVPDSNPFSSFVNALYLDSIIGGYTCGGVGEPCVPPGNRPYYRPNNNVTRAQMAKFVDNGRRNIADAVGKSLDVTSGTTRTFALNLTNSAPGANTLQITANGPLNYGASIVSNNSDGMDLYGADWGLYVRNSGSHPAIDASTSLTSSVGILANSQRYLALDVLAPSSNNGFVQMRVTGVGNTLYAERINNGALYVQGDLVVGGAKTGYVVDVMKNADSVALEPGDVVVVAADSAPAVLGQIPVPQVKRAGSANDSGVVGIVDAALYVPDEATRQAFEAQQAADQAAGAAAAQSTAPSKNKPSPQANIANRITDEQGTLHADPSKTSVAVGDYANVVTLGSYKMVKVDAGFGAIHAGDLLTTSPHAGYAMKVTDKLAALGAVIGKALSSLDSGTGTVTVMVSLK